MRVLDIEKLFQSEDTLDKVLEECKGDFEKIDYWKDLLKQGVVYNNPAEINRALTELAGAYANLRVVLGVAETEKKNREIRHKESIRIETEKNDKKYVDTKAETQASAFVANYRRIRNLIGGYEKASDKMITTLQNVNNNLDKNLRKNPSE